MADGARGVVVLCALTVIACGASTKKAAGTGAAVVTTAAPITSVATTAAPTAPSTTVDKYGGKGGDKDFAIEGQQISDNGHGNFGGLVRVKNVSQGPLSATKTLRIQKNGNLLTWLQGLRTRWQPVKR